MSERVAPPGKALAEAIGEPEVYTSELDRSLTFKENILITLSAVTPASSVFIIIPSVIAAIGGASALAFGIAAVVGIAVAFCYAELSSAFPITGGEYAFVARILGRPAGFALFILSLVSGIFILGVIAAGAGTYLSIVWPSLGGQWVGIAVIGVTTVVGCFQIRANAWVTGIFLVLELAALIVLTVLGFGHVTQPVSSLWHATAPGHGGTLAAVGAGAVIANTATALFAYNGYGTAVYYAEETKQATKTIGRAIMWSLIIAVAAEFIPLIAVLLGTPSMSGLQGSADPMSYFIKARGGEVTEKIVAIGIAIAIINAVLAIVLQMGRLLYSASRDRSWPEWLNRPLSTVHPTLKTPVVATLVVGITGAILLKYVPFNTMLIVTGSSLLITYSLVAIAAIQGRRTRRTSTAPYQMPGWPWVPIAMLIATGVVSYESWKSDWRPVVVALGIFAVGIPYYYFYLHPRRGDRWTLPDAPNEDD